MTSLYRDAAPTQARRIQLLERENAKLRARLRSRGARLALESIGWLVRTTFLVMVGCTAVLFLLVLFLVVVALIVGASSGGFGMIE